MKPDDVTDRPGVPPLLWLMAPVLGGILGWILGAPSAPAKPGDPERSTKLRRPAPTVDASLLALASPAPIAATPPSQPTGTQSALARSHPVNDTASYEALVASLERNGLGKKLSQYIALEQAVRTDQAASLEIAKNADLLDLWAAGPALIDPARTVELLAATTIRSDSSAAYLFATELGRLNPERGLGLLPKLNGILGYPDYSLFRGWAERNPEGALQTAMGLDSDSAIKRAVRGVMSGWDDTPSKFAWASKQEEWVMESAFGSLYIQYGVQNVDQVMGLVHKYPPKNSFGLEISLGEALAMEGPSSFKRIQALQEGSFRSSLQWRYFSKLATVDPDAYVDLMKSLPSESRSVLFNSGISEIGKKHPEAVAELLASTTERNPEGDEMLISAWSEKDPKAAFAWSLENCTGLARSTNLTSSLLSWVGSDAASASQAFANLPPGMQAKLLPGFASTWGAKDPEQAVAWASRLSQENRKIGLDRVTSGWADADPIAAAEGIAHLTGEELDNAFGDVARQVASRDIEYAKRWIDTLADETAKLKATGGMLDAWAGSDAVAASEYLGTLPPGKLRDVAIDRFARTARETDAESAARWALTISDEAKRDAALHNVAYAWREQDRPSAETFANQIEDKGLRDSLLKIIQSR